MGEDKKDTPELTPEKEELYRLSRMAKLSGISSLLFSFGLLAFIILLAVESGMDIFIVLLSLGIGYLWYKSVQIIGMSKEMKAFESIKDYFHHLEQVNKKESDDLF